MIAGRPGAACVSALLAIGAAPQAGAAERLVAAQVPVPASDRAGATLPPGSRIVSLDPSRPQDPVDLTAGFSAAGAPDVSFDGRRMLFVGRRAPGDALEVWEMSLEGGEPRRVAGGAGGAGECLSAVYLSAIYTIDDLRPAYQIAFCSAGPGAAPALYTCRMDGTGLRRITFSPLGETDPCALGDGRVLFSSADPDGGSSLLTVNTDGTDVFAFTASAGGPAVRGMACEIGDEVVYVESAGPGERGGSLVAVPRTASLHGRRLIAGAEDGLYRSPAPAGDGMLVVSYRARGAASYGLRLVDPRTGASAAVYDAPGFDEIGARSVLARPEPAGRSSVVDDRAGTGLLYCLDASMTDLAPGRGEAIRQVRVFGAAADGEGILATAGVEPDGSFYLSVPARTPLRLQTLDPEGRVIQSMRSWFWVMPREARGCIGCHEDRELSPPNRHALALRKPPQPVGPGPGAAP